MRKGKNGGSLKTGGNNGGGRPKRIPEIDTLLAEVLGEEIEGKTKAQEILSALMKEAVKGNVRAAEVLLNRAYGMAKQTIEQVSDKKIEIELEIVQREAKA